MFKTLAYFDLFDYPLTRKELIKYLHRGDSLKQDKKVSFSQGFYFLAGRQRLIRLRRQRLYFSQLKWQRIRQLKWLFKLIPWIKLVAVTGALAMDNARKNDDIDLLIITQANRLWLTRLLLFFFPYRRRRHFSANTFCFNLFLDESALELTQRNLFVAHELAQLKPLVDKDNTYQKLIKANLWLKTYLSNWSI